MNSNNGHPKSGVWMECVGRRPAVGDAPYSAFSKSDPTAQRSKDTRSDDYLDGRDSGGGKNRNKLSMALANHKIFMLFAFDFRYR